MRADREPMTWMDAVAEARVVNRRIANMRQSVVEAARAVRQHFLPDEITSARSVLRGCVLALLAICTVSFMIRVAHVSASLPYPQHIDERAIARPAANILKTGDFHPKHLQYPSLPTYLAAAAMAVGFIGAAPELEIQGSLSSIDISDHLGDVSYPFYTLPSVVEKARWLFALLSVGALAMSGVIAWQMLGRPGALILAPLVLALSPLFFTMSWRYLNVDIVGACFVTLAIAAALRGAGGRHPSLTRLAVMPAICAGLAAGSKYTYGLVLLPVMIAILLFMERDRRLEATAIAMATAGLSFLVVVPYSVIDLPAFINGLAIEAYHYAVVRHPNDAGAPGTDKLIFYATALSRDFGVAGLVLGLVGLVSATVSDWRRTLVVVSFPVALLAVLSMQKVGFERNILPIFPCVAVFITSGVIFLHQRLTHVSFYRRMNASVLRRAISVLAFLALLLLGLSAPLSEISGQISVTEESRTRAADWIRKHVATDTTIVVPEELHFDTRPLTSRGYKVLGAEFRTLDTAEKIDLFMADVPEPFVMLVPRWKASSWGWDVDSAKDKATALNRAAMLARLVPLADFSLQRGVLINYQVPGNGSPGFSIAKRFAGDPSLPTSLRHRVPLE